MTAQLLRETLTDSFRYWERMRLIYNSVLSVIGLTYFALNYPNSKLLLFSGDGILLIFILAVLANVAYCAAYIADVFAQISGFGMLGAS